MENDIEYYTKLLQEFKKTNESLDALTKRKASMREELVKFIVDNGYEDEKGHLRADLGEASLKYERRVSRSFDLDAAEAWAKETDIWDEIKEVIERLSEDKLLGYAWQHPEVEETIQSFYSEKESWALKT
jgi:hypothetical protein